MASPTKPAAKRANPFAGYKEGKESARQERAEPKALKQFEARKGIEKSMSSKRTAGRGR